MKTLIQAGPDTTAANRMITNMMPGNIMLNDIREEMARRMATKIGNPAPIHDRVIAVRMASLRSDSRRASSGLKTSDQTFGTWANSGRFADNTSKDGAPTKASLSFCGLNPDMPLPLI